MTYNSRDKLNSYHLLGSIGIGAIVGMIAQSWVLFILVAAALIAASVSTGEIRLPNRRRKS